ncbi:hypothetical protein DH2020_026034 [Rehmannia glutinosa]|uniref:RNA polymerase sigma-70 domain-containing protein n=1 Tax=Rehmannia glutinosa TaxID=99300 RepID=A0ABR0W0W3_REHGL
MEANLVTSPPQFPLRTHIGNGSSSSVLLLHEQVTPAVTSLSTTSLGRPPPTSVLIQDQRNESRPLLCLKADSTYQQTLDKRQLLMAPGLSSREGNKNVDPDEGLASVPVRRIVRSTRLLERQTKRRVPKPKIEIQETNHRRKPESHRKFNEGFDPNDPLRMFLWGPETTQLLTAKEESELIVKIQVYSRVNETTRSEKSARNSVFREPTLVEWAEAAGTSCHVLQSQVHCGNSSRDKLIYANFRMVVHIAKQYQGRGLSLQDLLQEGSMGLMKSVEKFKPQAGCRFATYAYWWIRQSIRKALFQHSRTIRLPENVYSLLSKVYEAKKSCVQQGNHYPTKEDIAACAGLSVERLEKLLYTARVPLSMQQPVWMDQNTTYQEITADTTIEVPEVGASKQIMREHTRNLLSVLNPRERKIIRLRFGIEGGEQKSLSEIGAGFGLSKERVRQLESRALYKLKQCLSSQGLEAYADMLI